ncbi:MAG TPA: hypothetical protein VN969_02455 [Streptosporangiaceae bacterium]|nr:hypothetical protein [Streptosporangiaceae bacterium]
MRWALRLSVAAAAATLIAGCGTAAVPQTSSGQNGADAGQLPGGVAKACDLPAQARPAPGQGLTGPAVTDLTSGAATHGFSLDGGQFSVMPPPSGDKPRASRAQAECEALAAVAPGGEPLIYADGVSGMAVGYGLVTVSPTLPVDSWQGYYPDITLPTPAPPRYQSRLAWVVVFRVFYRADCTGVSQTTPPSPGRSYTGYEYEVFIVDAATADGALSYDEAAPRECDGTGLFPPSVSIPVELTSVRWKLDSRGSHGSYATVTAYVPPCLDYEKKVQLDGDLVMVLAYGQVGASCGSPRPVTVRVEPARGVQSVWPTLAHAPTGLYLTGSGQGLPL